MTSRNRDSFAEWAIVALVVIVLGIAASRTNLEPADGVSSATVDRIAAQVRMQMPIARATPVGMPMPIARNCGRTADTACAQFASHGRP